MGKGYYVGLDMGTGSVGWAVTDESYQILRRHGKAMWGVRLFESAKTAEERRMFRTGRRRLDRRGWRIEILQEIFAEEISRVDPGFFLRMKESKYYPEDKRDIQGNCPELPYTLFVDKTFTDKDFHKKYPTIYHLRKMLMETEDTPDIRLVYLALHHMMKHRGHFLLSGDISQVTEFKNTFNQFIENIRNEGMDFEIELDESAVQMIEETLKDKNLTRSAKKAKLVKGLNAKNVRDKAFLTLLSGGTVKLSDLFGMEELNEGERPKISFADNRYEEYAAVVEMELGELYYIVESAKAVYDWAILSDILGGSTSVSDAKVRAYEKHKADLKYLKAVVKEYFPKEVYNAVFVESSDKLNNYPAYIGMTKKNGKKVSLEGKRCSREEFMDFLKKNIVVKLPDEETKMYLQSELEKDSFLPKQVNKDNGVIPYQVHKYELKKILDNLGDKIPFLKENAEKIEKLFSFRIPYYVGPLRTGNGENSKFAWAERKSTEKIYPWNFENVIDVEQSAENFIRRMSCDPKDSLVVCREKQRGYFFSDVQVRGKYPGYAWEYFKDNDINIEYTDEDMELIAKYPVDFLSFTYYRSRIASKDYVESVQKETNKSDKEVEGDTSYRGDDNIVNTGKTNPYLKITPSGWSIDPDGLFLALEDLYSRYQVPIFIAENGLGVKEELVDGTVDDTYRMEFLRDHIISMKKAIRNGVDLFGYAWWGPIDLVSNGSGQMSKRYSNRFIR